MGKGDKNSESSLRVGDSTSNLPMATAGNIAVNANGKGQYTWEEIRRHTLKTDRWLVIGKRVFDVTRWTKHPGGQAILNYYAGQDTTDAFQAFHGDIASVQKYLKSFYIGDVVDNVEKDVDEALKADFEQLRQTAISRKLFEPSRVFFVLSLLHILAIEFAAYFVLFRFGTSWIPYLACVVIYTTAEAQCGWLQHDFGHLSVFKRSSWNHLLHQFCMCFIKGASADWWNHMHYQHHAKPNVIDKDPDTRIETLFLLGDTIPIRKAQTDAKHGKKIPYNLQHLYFFVVAPLLFPVYFQVMTLRHAFKRRKWMDLVWMSLFYIKFLGIMSIKLGLLGAMKIHFVIRALEGTWFVIVAQSNHVVMDVAHDDSKMCWFRAQLRATCNIAKSTFNDWFTGHLNFQIEHHLFPMMPRHNLYKIQPEVMDLCRKYNIPYIVKPMGRAFADIFTSLEKSGRMWLEAYEEILESPHPKED